LEEHLLIVAPEDSRGVDHRDSSKGRAAAWFNHADSQGTLNYTVRSKDFVFFSNYSAPSGIIAGGLQYPCGSFPPIQKPSAAGVVCRICGFGHLRFTSS